MHMPWVRGCLVAVVVLVASHVSAAGKDKGDPAEGQRIYDRDCASCHGKAGKGDGPDGLYFTNKPTDFTTQGLLAKRSDDFLATVITVGGPAKGLSADMPGSKLSKSEVQSLIVYVRQFAPTTK
jgi:mono/diheme cytochrome c family protein